MDENDPCAGIPAIDPNLDRRFRHLTLCGQRARREGAVADAEMFHREAGVEADALFVRAVQGGAAATLIAPMAMTISAQNLATLKNAAGEPTEAKAILEGATTRLIAAAASAETPLALRLNCLRHLRYALHFLADLDHAQGGPGHGASPLAERTAAVAAEVIRIAEILKGSGAKTAEEPVRSSSGSSRRAITHGRGGM